MLLFDILKGLDYKTPAAKNMEISDIVYDSRKAGENTVFVCIDGYAADGHNYAMDAYDKGARVFVVSKDIKIPEEGVKIFVDDTRMSLALISANFFGHPSEKLELTGITGTKGKTTSAVLVSKILNENGILTGNIGTLGNFLNTEPLYVSRSTPTTPESYELQQLFSKMLNRDVKNVVMEVTSQALKLNRVAYNSFKVGVFMNITHDHISEREHSDMDDYFLSKAKLFQMCRTAFINIDNEYSQRLLDMTDSKCYTFSAEQKSDIYVKNVTLTGESSRFYLVTPWGETRITTNLLGKFNLYNIMAAAGVCGIYGVTPGDMAKSLEEVYVPGRLEEVPVGREFSILIDYAHTPASLENVLKSLKTGVSGRLICVFGCGGDRDTAKRPIMGKISTQLADFTVITSDNPRTEEPEDIINQIEEGAKLLKSKYITVTDRKKAIEHAIGMAQKGDIILLAGKGQETYQMFKDRTIHFDEREVVKEILGI